MIEIRALIRSTGPNGPQVEALTRLVETGSVRLVDVTSHRLASADQVRRAVAAEFQISPDTVSLIKRLAERLG